MLESSAEKGGGCEVTCNLLRHAPQPQLRTQRPPSYGISSEWQMFSDSGLTALNSYTNMQSSENERHVRRHHPAKLTPRIAECLTCVHQVISTDFILLLFVLFFIIGVENVTEWR